jgi:pimeloyl-ACP methyl ester carboxylesterase
MTFNLGGMLGVLFTRGIFDTAEFLAEKMKRQIERYNFPEVQFIGYSKGGLVAVHYLFHMPGFEKRCSKLITLGTPFSGAYQTYMALVTPLAFFWSDLWQMRPGSAFLEEIADAHVPEGMEVHCIYSEKDRFSRGRNGIYRPRAGSMRVKPKAMHQCNHFAFLTDARVVNYVHQVLTGAATKKDAQPKREGGEVAADEPVPITVDRRV